MRKLIPILFLAFFSMAALAQESANTTEVQSGPVLKFDNPNHDFGKIDPKGAVSHEFTFINDGNEPLIISKTKASCGCTASKPPKHPIMPGEEGSIMVTFNPKGKSGRQGKSVTVTYNSSVPGEIQTARLGIVANIVK